MMNNKRIEITKKSKTIYIAKITFQTNYQLDIYMVVIYSPSECFICFICSILEPRNQKINSWFQFLHVLFLFSIILIQNDLKKKYNNKCQKIILMAFFFLLVIFQSVWFCTTINMDSIMTEAANSVVYKKLPTCNITCTYCVDVTNLNICGACPTNLNLVNNSCIGNVENYYDQFFMDASLSNSRSNSTGWTISNNTNLIFNSCVNTYVNFEVLGLFNINEYIIWKKSYNNQIESSYVKFRALFYLNPITFIASMNNILVLNNTPNGTPNHPIDCTFFDNASYVDYYKSFTSDIMSSKTFDILLNISTSSSTANIQIWGIREVVIVSVKCTTCISSEIIQKARIGGILLGIFVGSLILLIIPIYLINLYNIKRKNEIRNQPHFRVSKNIYKNIYLYPEQD